MSEQDLLLCDVCRRPLSAHNRGAGIPICPGIYAPSYRNDLTTRLAKAEAMADELAKHLGIAIEVLRLHHRELGEGDCTSCDSAEAALAAYTAARTPPTNKAKG